MRWLFPHPSEASAREQVLEQANRFWKEFAERTGDIDALFKRRKNWDLRSFINGHLHAISPDLMWDFGAGVGGGHRFTVTPESRKDLRPLVDALLSRAPKLEGWQFGGYRLPIDPEGAVSIARQLTGAQLKRVGAEAVPGDGGAVDITVHLPQGDPPSSWVPLVEHVLGEEVLDKWVGQVDTQPYPGLFKRQPPGLDALKAQVDGLIAARRGSLPKEPWSKRPVGEWTALQGKPPQQPDYAGTDDLLLAVTSDVELWQTAHSGAAFRHERFSALGELFCYLKIDGAAAAGTLGFPDRGALEDLIKARVEPEHLGAVVGGGTGYRYSYVDLVLTRPELAIPRMREALVSAGMTKRAWLLFFERELGAEWIGVHDDSPKPLLRSSVPEQAAS